MDNRDRVLINTMLSSIEGQISAIRTILSVSVNYDHSFKTTTPEVKNQQNDQFTSQEEDAELDKMMGSPTFEDSEEPRYLSVPEMPGILTPSPGLVESKSVASGMVGAMASAMNSIVADAHAVSTEG